ncbi:hypothetical protein J2857_003109 [Neorhizobium galegae]|uniref:hypothetical protein n=1 Tax=Neorhizobium galegae TaxID=399 RepID=UPI001AEA4618|nr:hypothetical protein [Neorhizobium galegae]MBP2560340.1 hypothetical protein [Neorhizobium galegae]
MANKEIPELTAASTITGAELVHVVQGGNSRKVPIDGLFNTTHKIGSAAFLTSLRLYDSTDNTKGIAIDASAVATGTTRTITMPNSNVDLGLVAAADIKAWVNFNGTGTVAIRASRNVSSITDLGVGYYRINFTTDMADTNFATFISVGTSGSTAAQAGKTFAKNVAWVEIYVTNSSGPTLLDMDDISVGILR